MIIIKRKHQAEDRRKILIKRKHQIKVRRNDYDKSYMV